MTHEEVRSICKEEIIEAAKLSNDFASKVEALKKLSNKITSAFDLIEVNMILQERNGKQYILYNYRHTAGGYSRGGVEFNPETISEDLVNCIITIVDGFTAVEIINKQLDSVYDKNGAKVRLWYSLGCTEHCTISQWDYSTIFIRTSRKSTIQILSEFRKGASSFELYISNAIDSDNYLTLNLVESLSKFNESKLNKNLLAEIELKNIGKLLTYGAITRAEAIQVIADNRRKLGKGTVSVRIAEEISQLGNFVVAYNIKIDLKTLESSIGIEGDRVIDIDNLDIITNIALVSRIEQVLRLKDYELSLIN